MMAGEGKEMTWLPEQHEEQLQLGFRIIDNSFKNKVHGLEQEIRALKLTNEEKTQQLTMLQKKNSSLEVELIEAHQKAQQVGDENKELYRTVQALRKQIQRLEEMKKLVASSLSDVEQRSAEDSNALIMSDDYLRSAVPYTASNFPGAGPALNTGSVQNPMMAFAMSPQAGAAPRNEGSPNSGIVDGKQFFRNARARLSYESFNLFLANIKRLNNHAQSRDETLEESRRIFGNEHRDLYEEFVQLLNRHS